VRSRGYTQGETRLSARLRAWGPGLVAPLTGAALLVIVLLTTGCGGDQATSSTATTTASTVVAAVTTTQTSVSATTSIPASSTTAFSSATTGSGQGSTTASTAGLSTTTQSNSAARSTTTTAKATTTTTQPTTTTTQPTTTTEGGAIPPLPEGATLQVITPDGRAVPFTLKQLAALPLHHVNVGGKIQEGPLLLDVLHAAGVTTFSKVVLTGSKGPTYVNTATADQVDDTFVLDFTNHGTVKVGSPLFGLQTGDAKDIYLIQVY
jgi:hypothetical protein